MAKVMSTVTVVDGRVRLNHGDDSYTEYLTGQAIQLGGFLIREAYKASGIPVPENLTLTFRD